jgi:hypothetical protein
MMTVVFVSPLRALWASDASPWWVSFALWGALLVLAAVAVRSRGADDAD